LQTEHVVVATGHDQVPHQPDWPGADSFPGRILHVAQLVRAADLAGRAVVLVGAGNSGVEIAGHLVNAGVSQLWVSVRTSPNIMPRELAGEPLHPITPWLRLLPEPARDGVARAVGRLAFGDLARHGLPTPKQGPYARLRTSGVTVAVDHGFVEHLKAGHLEIVAQVKRFEGNKVILGDGRILCPDVVLAATGFGNGLYPLLGHLGILDTQHRPPGHSSAPGLWFTGFRVAIEGNLRQHPGEARRIAGAIATARAKSVRSDPQPAPNQERYS
jgi:putative flavoprotein involved in K+ transport